MSCRNVCRTERAHQALEKKEGHTHSTILAKDLTYNQALDREKKEAESRGCRHSGGGQKVPGNVWSVYHVWGGR